MLNRIPSRCITVCLSNDHFWDLLSFWNLWVEIFHPFWNILGDCFFKYYFCLNLSLSSPRGLKLELCYSTWFGSLIFIFQSILSFFSSLCFSLHLFHFFFSYTTFPPILEYLWWDCHQVVQMNLKLYFCPFFAWLTLSHHLDFMSSGMTSLVSKMRPVCSTFSKYHMSFLLRTRQRCHFS